MENRSISDFAVSKVSLVDAECHIDRSIPISKGRARMDFPVTLEIGSNSQANQVVSVITGGSVSGYAAEDDSDKEVFHISVSVIGSFLPNFSVDGSPSEEEANELISILSPLVYQYVREYILDLARKMGINGLAVPMALPKEQPQKTDKL